MLEMVSFILILTLLGYPWLFLPNEADDNVIPIEEESVIVLEDDAKEDELDSVTENDTSSENLGNTFLNSTLSPDLRHQVIDQYFEKQDEISFQTRKIFLLY